MSRLRWQVSVTGEVPDVWDHLVDWDRMHTWFAGVRRVTLQAPESSVGAIRLLHLVYGTTHRERITRWEPPAGFSIVVVDPTVLGRRWTADVDLRQRGPRVELSWELHYEPRFGLAGRLIDRLVVKPCIDAAFRLSLRRLRASVEDPARL